MVSSNVNEHARAISLSWVEDHTPEGREALRAEAKKVVEEHYDELAETFAGMDHAQLVTYTNSAREDGDEVAVARANLWALGAMPRQRIVGAN